MFFFCVANYYVVQSSLMCERVYVSVSVCARYMCELSLACMGDECQIRTTIKRSKWQWNISNTSFALIAQLDESEESVHWNSFGNKTITVERMMMHRAWCVSTHAYLSVHTNVKTKGNIPQLFEMFGRVSVKSFRKRLVAFYYVWMSYDRVFSCCSKIDIAISVKELLYQTSLIT